MEKLEPILERIRDLRKVKGLTQLEMSERIGMAKNNYGKLENGHIELSVKRLLEIADILEVSVFSLLGFETGDQERISKLEGEIVQLRMEKTKADESLATINRLFAMVTSSIEKKESEFKDSMEQAPDLINLIKSTVEDIGKDAKLADKAQKLFK